MARYQTLSTPYIMTVPASVTAAAHGTAGATTYTYKVVAVDVLGGTSAASSAATAADGNATLTGTNHIAVAWDAVPGATSYKVYRTAGGAAQGYVATVTGAVTTNDTGLVATVVTPPSVDTSGLGTALDIWGATTKLVQATGTFTGTIQIQGSLDGTTWVNEGSAITAAGALAITNAWNYLRSKCTAYTSGTPVVMFAAVNR
jgi:hypothetical protein